MAQYLGFVGDSNEYNNARNRANLQGSSPAFSYLALAGATSPVQRILLAMGGMLRGDHPTLSPGGYSMFCYMASKCMTFTDSLGGIDPIALGAGMVSARWLYQSQNNVSDEIVNGAIRTIADLIVPTMQQYSEIMRTCLTHVREVCLPAISEVTAEVVPAGTSEYHIGVINGTPSYIGRVITLLEGGGLPWAKIYGQDVAVATINNRETARGFFRDALHADWHLNWTNREVLSFCNFVARHNPDLVRAFLMRSMFMCLAGIVKGSNMTPNWVQTRWETLRSQYSILATRNEVVTKEQVVSYAKHFIGGKPILADLYSGLTFIHRMSDVLRVEGLRWIIEQARGTNITGLSAVANAMVQFDICTYTILTRSIPAESVTQALNAMLYTIRMPYGTLAGPYIPIVRYADAAYIGVSLTISAQTEQLLRGLENRVKTEKGRLKALVDQIMACQRADGARSMSVEQVIGYYGMNAAPSLNNTCGIVAYPDFAIAAIPNEDGQAEARRNLINLQPNVLATLSNQLTPYTLRDMIQKANVDVDTAAVRICRAFLAAIEQAPIVNDRFFVPEAGNVAPLPLPDTLQAAIAALNLTNPEIGDVIIPVLEGFNDHEFLRFPAPAPGN